MKKWWTAALCALLLPGLLAGCGAAAEEGCVWTENGELVVALEGNPTTGYAWVLEAAALDCLSGGQAEYVADAGAEELVGTGGRFYFRFTPTAAGTQTLRFVYERSWEENSAADEFVLTVTVKNSAGGFTLSWR